MRAILDRALEALALDDKNFDGTKYRKLHIITQYILNVLYSSDHGTEKLVETSKYSVSLAMGVG